MAFNYWQELEEGAVYHIYNKAISDLKLFRDEKDYYNFLEKYTKYFHPYFKTYAYCLIPNHFHVLIRVKTRAELLIILKNEPSKKALGYIKEEISFNELMVEQFRRFFSSVTLSYNKKYKHEGPIFVKKLKRIRISKDGTIVNLLCYIHHNPIHHGLAVGYNQWLFSSFSSYIETGRTRIAKKEMLDWLGGDEVFKDVHENFKLERKLHNID